MESPSLPFPDPNALAAALARVLRCPDRSLAVPQGRIVPSEGGEVEADSLPAVLSDPAALAPALPRDAHFFHGSRPLQFVLVPDGRARVTHDTPRNRFLKAALPVLRAALTAAAPPAAPGPPGAAPSPATAAAPAIVQRLDRLLRALACAPFLAAVPPATASDLGSNDLLTDPAIRIVLQAYLACVPSTQWKHPPIPR